MLRLVKPSRKAWIVSLSLLFAGTGIGALTWIAWHSGNPQPSGQPTQAAMLASLLGDENKMADILKTIAPGTNPITESGWQTQLDTVKKAESQLSALAVSPSTVPIKQAALTALTSIANAWNSLIDTQKTHDTAAYEKAVATLTTAYQSLGNITTQSDKAYTTLAQTAAAK